MSIAIREVPLETIWQMRQVIMYPQLNLDAVKLSDDTHGFHLGLYDGDMLCSVISLFERNNELQFRKFATVNALQRKGYGKQLLRQVFAYAESKGMQRIWCNARTTATKLYEQFGMQPFGATWEEHGHQFVKMETPCPPKGGT